MNLPEFLQPFFWEYTHESIDTIKHASTIMARIMGQGSWRSTAWLRETYSKEQIKDFLIHKGINILPPRELNYWLLISDITPEERRKLVDSAKTKHASWRGHAF